MSNDKGSGINDQKKNPQPIGERAFLFSVNVIQLLKTISKDEVNRIIIHQLIRSATSIGANIEEAQGAHTKSDFSHCMNIAKKEALETRYWLRLLEKVNVQYKRIAELIEEINEIIKILITIVKRSNPRSFIIDH